MIAIVVQTALSLVVCFTIGFVTAWIVRGGREERKFQSFFESWRSRYDQLERECDLHRARINALQQDLHRAQGKLEGRDQTGAISAKPTAPTIGIEQVLAEKST